MIQMSPFAPAPNTAVNGACKSRLRKFTPSQSKAECDERPYCFISYARKDEETVRRFLHAANLKQDLLWIDRNKLEPGGRWSADIVSAIRRASSVIVFCSHRAFASHDVYREVALAGRFDQPIIAIFLDEAAAPDEFLYYLSIHEAMHISEPNCVERMHRALDALSFGPSVRQTTMSGLFRSFGAFACVFALCLGLWLFFLTGGLVSASEWRAVRGEAALDPFFSAMASVQAHVEGWVQQVFLTPETRTAGEAPAVSVGG